MQNNQHLSILIHEQAKKYGSRDAMNGRPCRGTNSLFE